MTPAIRAPGAAAALAVALLAGCSDDAAVARAIAGGDPERGRLALRRYGCGTCHEISGVGAATGHVGPPLTALGARIYLAGRLPNTPDHLIEWIRWPQSVEPGNVMPDMGVTAGDATDIAAFLYAQR
jgi:cytochrome c